MMARRKWRRLVAAILGGLAGAGCAPSYLPPTPIAPVTVVSGWREAPKVHYDPFAKQTEVTSPSIVLDRAGGGLETTASLSGVVKDAGSKSLSLFLIESQTTDWRAYDHAYDRDGRELKVSRVRRDVSCTASTCFYLEAFVIPLDEAAVREAAKVGGYTVSVRGYSRREIALEPQYLADFFQALDAPKPDGQ